MYKVIFRYPNGETKDKCKGIILIETALKVMEHYDKFFQRGGFTLTPDGAKVEADAIQVDFEEYE